MVRKTVYFSGHVQGVGFRWTTRQVAGGYDVTGYVKNETDGRVLLVVEGEPAEVDAMLDELRGAMAQHIRDEQVDASPATGQFQAFGIAH